jgi:hypothetical protein
MEDRGSDEDGDYDCIAYEYCHGHPNMKITIVLPIWHYHGGREMVHEECLHLVYI